MSDLADKVAEFVRDKVVPYEQDPRNGPHGPDLSLVSELQTLAREHGLLTPQLKATSGESNVCYREIGRIFRAAGHSPLGPVALNCMSPDEGNIHLLERVATEPQKQRFLRPLIAGECRSAFMMTEPDGGAGSDPALLMTTAKLEDDCWVIKGRKTLITGAEGAKFGIIMARTDENATMFLCDMDVPGVAIERILDTLDSSMPGGHAIVRLSDVRIPLNQVLGELNQGFRYAQVRLAPARLTHCMRWWGLARRAQDIAIDYACRRMAFGKPLIDHEGVGFMLADNEIELQQALLMMDWAADILDSGATGSQESSMAKVSVSEGLFRVADRCVQVLGGLGITRDTIVEQAFREIRAFRIYDGPSEVHRWSLARSLKRNHRP